MAATAFDNCTILPVGGPNYFVQFPNRVPNPSYETPYKNNMRFLLGDVAYYDWYSEMARVDVFLGQYTPGQPKGYTYPPLTQLANDAETNALTRHSFTAVRFLNFGNGTDSTLYYLVARNRSNATAPCAEFQSGLFNISAPDTDYRRLYGIGLGVGLGVPLFLTLIALVWALLALKKQSVREKSSAVSTKIEWARRCC